MKTLLTSLRTISASLRMLLVFTVILGIAYPLAVTAIAQVPGLKSRADGSLLSVNGHVVGSRLLGQEFNDDKGNPLAQYLQPRPSAAGDGYDPTATSASNLGPESIVDTLADPSDPSDQGKQSLLTQVCARSLAIGQFDGVSGARPYCTSDGVGAVLGVLWSGPRYNGTVTRVISLNQTTGATPFLSSYKGVRVELARFGQDYAKAQVVPIRGDAPSQPSVPADAVTSSGSGLDPDISPAYATLQVARVAQARGITPAQVKAVIARYSTGRGLGFLGEPRVNVLQVNAALDARYPNS